MNPRIASLSLFSWCFTSALVGAESASSFEFTGEVAAKLNYNSALSVDELDDVSSQGDSGQRLEAKFTGRWQATDNAKLTTSYAYQRQHYNQTSRYDLSLHQVGLDGAYKRDGWEIGGRLDAVSASLRNDKFLDFQQASVYTGHFVQSTTFLRADISAKNKSFAQAQGRDASAIGASASLFHFVNDTDTMLMLGLSTEKEHAEQAQFSYRGVGINSKVSHKFSLLGADSKATLGWRYVERDYQAVQGDQLTDPEPVERDEQRHIVSLGLAVTLIDNLTLTSEFEHGNYGSQLESLNYQQNLATVGLSYAF